MEREAKILKSAKIGMMLALRSPKKTATLEICLMRRLFPLKEIPEENFLTFVLLKMVADVYILGRDKNFKNSIKIHS